MMKQQLNKSDITWFNNKDAEFFSMWRKDKQISFQALNQTGAFAF